MPCREIEQDLNWKIQKVGPKAKRPQNKMKNKNNIPTHPMTIPLKQLVKNIKSTYSVVIVRRLNSKENSMDKKQYELNFGVLAKVI